MIIFIYGLRCKLDISKLGLRIYNTCYTAWDVFIETSRFTRHRCARYAKLLKSICITGKSTAVFIRSVRLQKAKELIQTTDKTISEIAYEVGFNDPSWFGRAFKEEFGFVPSAISKP